MATVERIDMMDHSVQPPALIASFFWSEATGLTGTNDFLMEDIERNGIHLPDSDGGGRVYPVDGRVCFLALKWRGSSFIEVTEPREVASG